MIKEVKGNLLEATEDIIAHQVNCKGVMGAGVAKQIKQNLLSKEGFNEYYNLCKTMSSSVLLGSNHWCKANNGKHIVNMFGEDIPTGKRLDTNYDALNSCLLLLMKNAKEKGLSVALPGYIGCGLAGGDWNRAYRMIKKAAAEYSANVTIYYLDSSVKLLWKEFGNVPMDSETECMEENWHGFASGTHRKDIWCWFENTFDVNVTVELMGMEDETLLPSLEQIQADYQAFREITKDVRTLEDIKRMRKLFAIEVNGVSVSEYEEMPTPLEWVRYDGYGCLEEIYDRFDGKPQFQINCQECEPLRYLVIGTITEDDLTPENHSIWKKWLRNH